MSEVKSPYAPPEFVGLGADNYLGNPHLVTRLVAEYCSKCRALLEQRAAGQIDEARFVKLADGVGGEFADIFAGRNPAFTIIIGYNNVTLNARLRVELGSFWQENRDRYGDDPYRAFFGWLLWAVFNAWQKADGDDTLEEVIAGPSVAQAVRLLLGTDRRA